MKFSAFTKKIIEMKKIAIMQPYFFPYIGYFQLINAVDKFVFYDDVNYINKGWINRNNIIVNGHAKFINIPLKKASQNKLIKDVFVVNSKDLLKILKTIEYSYKKAPFFKEVFNLITDLFLDINNDTSISDFNIKSTKQICEFLNINTIFFVSSNCCPAKQKMEKAERLINICKLNNCNIYINPLGGIELYDKKKFKNRGVDILFLKSETLEYKQFKGRYISNLSIIDVMMFNNKEQIKEMLTKYILI